MIWNTFYDESFSDRKITLNKGKLNFWTDNALDFYISVFLMFPQGGAEQFKRAFLSWERDSKELLGLDSNVELKGDGICKKKQFRNGFASFHKNTLKIYSSFFEILINHHHYYHVNIYSKMELLLKNIIDINSIPGNVDVNAFMYSLIKLLGVYQDEKIVQSILEPKYDRHFQRELVRLLKIIKENTEGVQRKERELSMINDLLKIIPKLRVKKLSNNRWNYHVQVDGFLNLISELGINEYNVNIYPDKDSGLLKILNEYNFSEINERQSEDCVGIRTCDILSNLLGRLLKSYNEAIYEDPMADIINHDHENHRDIHLEWFDVNEEQFLLYKKVSTYFESKKSLYWSSLTGSYFDGPVKIFSVIHYFGDTYDNYEAYSKLSIAEHSIKYKENLNAILLNSYGRF